jgi:hypothetical protein
LTGDRDLVLDLDLLLLREYGLLRATGLRPLGLILLLRGLRVRLRRRVIGERFRGDRERLRGVRERERLRDRLRIGDLSLGLPFLALSSERLLISSYQLLKKD